MVDNWFLLSYEGDPTHVCTCHVSHSLNLHSLTLGSSVMSGRPLGTRLEGQGWAWDPALGAIMMVCPHLTIIKLHHIRNSVRRRLATARSSLSLPFRTVEKLTGYMLWFAAAAPGLPSSISWRP